jgi:hypothetical protein
MPARKLCGSQVLLRRLRHLSGSPSRQFFEQRLRLFQVCRVKPFGEPVVDLGEYLPGLFLFALLLP